MIAKAKPARKRGRLLVIDWDKASAAAHAARLRDSGWTVVTESEDGARAYASVRKAPPKALVVDLTTKPSHSRETVRAILSTKAHRDLPVFVFGGTDADRKSLTAVAPAVRFVTAAGLSAALDAATRDM